MNFHENDLRDLRTNAYSKFISRIYRYKKLRRVGNRLINVLDVDPMVSKLRRELLMSHCSVYVGAYSYGPFLQFGKMPPNLSVGRYVSVASDVNVFRRNHPTEFLSLHPYFYNPELGIVDREIFSHEPLEICHDAWIGSGVKITPGCRRIGVGAVIGAGAVVTKDIPDFAIAMGVPARIVRFRFPLDFQGDILYSRWWELPIEELAKVMEHMCQPASKLELAQILQKTKYVVRPIPQDVSR